MQPPRSFHRSTVLVLGTGLFSLAAVVRAQQPFVPTAPAVTAASPTPAPASFDFQLGRVVSDENGVHSVFTLRATQPRDSKQVSQKIRFSIEDTTPQGTTTRQLSLNTGKHKTVAQLCGELRSIFRKYQTVRTGEAGTEIGKIGDLKYGGEIRFVAESAENLRYDMQTEGEENHSTKLSASEVSTLVALLGEPGAPAPH